jgi:hypothetical protein
MAAIANAAATVDIHAIQDNLPKSPYLGQTVTTTGIVIAVLSDGFYIENPTADFDSNTCTSEGIYVYTPTGVPSNAVLANSLTVTGLVQASNSSSYAGTEIYIASPVVGTNVVTQSSGNALPTAIESSVMTAATGGVCSDYAAGAFGQWLPFEGMRVNVPSSSSLLVTQGTGGTVVAASQTATTNGQFWGSFTTTRPFRATGISELETVPSTAPSTVSRWSGNPQLLLVDTTILGGTAINATAGTLYTGSSGLIGIIDYHVSTLGYTGLLLTSASVSSLAASNAITATAASIASSGQITLATQDLDSLTDTETKRITKLAKAIVAEEHSPDILAVQGVTPAALVLLESAIAAAGGSSYSDLSVTSTADSNNYVNAFLVNTSKFNNPTVTQLLPSATYTTTSGTSAALFDRTPLALTVGIPRAGTTDYNVLVVNSRLLARANIDSTTLGPDARNRREQQAEILTTQVLEPAETSSEHLFVLGGFSSFEFSDGYVDSLGILNGSEATNTSTGNLVTLYDSTYNTTVLENTTTTATNVSASATNPVTERYTYVENGSAEQPDHILISTEMSELVSIDYARFGADSPVSETYDTTTVNRASSHDGIVAYLTVPYPSTLRLTASPVSPSTYGETVTFKATVMSTGGTPTGTVTFYDGSTEVGTGTLTSGVATYATGALAVGIHTIKAIYGGSAVFDTSSATISYTVDVDVTTLTLKSSLNPSYSGDSVTFTATASSSEVTPTGTVTFTDLTTSAVLGTGTQTSGTTMLTISTLSVGTHVIEASYSGDTTNGAATSTLSQVVLATYPTTSKITCAPNPAAYGATVTCADTVASTAGIPSGTVTFYDGTAGLGTQTLSSGAAAYTTNSLAVGSHSITAVYAGLDAYQASTSNAVVEVVLSTFALSISPTSRSVYTGEPASYIVTVTPGTGFTLNVALACSGIPANTTCALTPSTVTGGSGTATLLIKTTAPGKTTTASLFPERDSASGHRSLPLVLARSLAIVGGIVLLLIPHRLRHRGGWFAAVLFCAGIAFCTLSGCGGSSTATGGTPVGSYTITVSGSALDGTIPISGTATTTLTVKSLF